MAAVDEMTTENHAPDAAGMAAILADLTAIHASIVAITAQLDADAGVTDTDYAANNDPAALTLTAS